MNRQRLLSILVSLILVAIIGANVVQADTVRFTGTVGAVYRVYISAGTEVTVEFNCLQQGLVPGVPSLAAGLPLPITPNNQLIDLGAVIGGDATLDSCGLRGYYIFIAPLTGEYQFFVIEAGFGRYELIIRGADIRDAGSSSNRPWHPDDRLNPDMAAEVAVYALNETLQVYGLNELGMTYLFLAVPFSEIVCEPAPVQTAPTITNQAGTISATCLSTGEIQVSVVEGAIGTLNFSPGDLTCNAAPAAHTEIAASADGQTRLYCLDTGEIQLNINKGHEELVYVWDQMPPAMQTTYVFDTTTGEQLSHNTQTIVQ